MSGPNKKVSAGAKAVVTIELAGLGSWGTDCTIEQIHRQAAETAEGRVRNAFQKSGERVRIITVETTSVSTERVT